MDRRTLDRIGWIVLVAMAWASSFTFAVRLLGYPL